MQLTIKIKILPSKEQETIIANTLNEYIRTINNTVLMLIKKTVPSQLTSKDIIADLPSAVKNQAIRDSKSVYSKYRKTRKQSILKKPMCIWNNQNYNEKNLHTWSFYRLAQFIEYKARSVSQCTETALEQSISYTQL